MRTASSQTISVREGRIGLISGADAQAAATKRAASRRVPTSLAVTIAGRRVRATAAGLTGSCAMGAAASAGKSRADASA